ncbi:MAG TPA: phytanoyl-CoA dioxygenase family protein [Saprospiraceae bacterium]|nr:phytanoyl-CoA dioxygenase family protein [Saprospiraceae bacterium]
MSTALQRLFAPYKGLLRRLKAAYVINNWLNADGLRHNRDLYRRYGLRKSIFAPIGYADFDGQHHPDIPWLDQPDAALRLERHPQFASFEPAVQEQMKCFVREGYMILRGLVGQDETDALNAQVEEMLHSGQARYNYTGRKIFNLWERSDLADREFFRRPELLRILSFLLGKTVIPFQSMNFTMGSEQRAHSDLIHMTTEPPGYLIAAWIALEDCPADAGPLFYYPGSHRLDFVGTEHYESGNTTFLIGTDSNRRYEDKIEHLIQEHGLQPQMFTPRRGDVLIWHANLLHGGSRISRPGATRRSMVCHYFAEGVICYHEMSQRPALLPKTRSEGV